MSKVTALFFTLLLCTILAHAMRPQPAFQQESSLARAHQQGVEAVDESCEGVGEDECLVRRTLAAHVDYIYTQKHNP
ncbi:phytosulfokines-like [Cajanus cajan]|uniref:Phytosulfokine n=1 Tax=Cajanus cajan TaxID=3821 RepID=A0A151QL87_CAJCA|nr:phytosulfokines [Cajanus cajan]XP_020229638.1 phytosulfokines-like [Cajanus cajan]KYP31055.1 Phytosulfokines 3 [Cajanus cajan]